jgi:hypothetical protein
MTSIVLSAAMVTAFAVDSTADAEARQTAARVRSSLLTHDWSWLQEVELRKNDDIWKFLVGISNWALSVQNIDDLLFRMNVLFEICDFLSPYAKLQLFHVPSVGYGFIYAAGTAALSTHMRLIPTDFKIRNVRVPAWGPIPDICWDPLDAWHYWSWENAPSKELRGLVLTRTGFKILVIARKGP